jgi:hypothetical protein
VNFAVLPRAPCRSKSFVHVASKQVFIGSICTCCCWCKSPIDLPAASKFSLIMKSWTDQNCQIQIWLLLLLLLLQPGESGGGHSARGRKQKYSRRTERQLGHSGLLHLLTIRHLYSICEHFESSSSCCCCSCLDLGIFFFFFFFFFFFSSCNITTWS